MAETEQKTPSYQEAFGGKENSHDELVAPFEDIKEEDFFEKDIDAEQADDYNEEDVPEREYIPMPSIFEPIPEEAQKEILSKFALKKREKDEVVATTAQRLVNQFRALSAFRSDYVVTYNNELMNTSDEIINFLPNIIGGPAVREYLDYLLAQKKQGKEYDQENIDFSITNEDGYLPSPEEDFAVPTTGGQSLSLDPALAQGQANALQKAITELQKANETQAQALNESIQLLKSSIENVPASTSGGAVSGLSSNDVNAIVEGQRKMMEEALEKLIQMQSRLFSDTVDELSKTVQEVQAQFRPVGAVRQALSSLKASSQKKDEKLEKQEKTEKHEKADLAEKDAFPLLKEVVKEDETTPVVEKKDKKASSPRKKPQQTVQIEDGEYEILTEFDIQED